MEARCLGIKETSSRRASPVGAGMVGAGSSGLRASGHRLLPPCRTI